MVFTKDMISKQLEWGKINKPNSNYNENDAIIDLKRKEIIAEKNRVKEKIKTLNNIIKVKHQAYSMLYGKDAFDYVLENEPHLLGTNEFYKQLHNLNLTLDNLEKDHRKWKHETHYDKPNDYCYKNHCYR